MPAADKYDEDRDGDKDGKQKSSSSKSKDLSHVPCKFYKIGGCTAGSGCPFSHSMQEPGAHKEVCTWFVKGNCKFGHKCALAHILPGQSMSMDRKNKKAAQAASGGSGAKESNGRGRGGPGGGRKDNQGSSGRNPFLSGGAPSNLRSSVSTGRPPMALKASISPSAPAPALKDTDFASFAALDALDESNELASAPAQGKISKETGEQKEPVNNNNAATPTQPINLNAPTSDNSTPQNKTATLPVSSPRRNNHSPNANVDFGPIGSPPRSIPKSPASITRTLRQGTSPTHQHDTGFLSSSPFSAPGTQTSFQFGDRRAMAASSLGTNFVMGPRLGNRHDQQSDDINIEIERPERGLSGDSAVDDDLEEFIPGSLSDLLTPEERQRRMSRSNSGQGAAAVRPDFGERRTLGVPLGGNGVGAAPGTSPGHRYSHSVPAPSLLADIGNIWSDPNLAQAGLPGSPSRVALGAGTPGSFSSASAFGGRSFTDDIDYSVLSPTNASAAFLPGLHQHYKSRQGAAPMPLGRGLRHTSNPLFAPGMTGGVSPSYNSTTAAGLSAQIAQYTNTGPRTAAFESAQFAPQSSIRPIPNQPQPQGDDHILSPGSRALQAHNPGQSLPQGLAAGYSRIHAMPPVPIASPGANMGAGGFSISPGVGNLFGNGPYGTNNTEWNTIPAPPPAQAPNAPPGITANYTQLESGKMSYLAMASRTNSAHNANLGSPPGIPRNSSANSAGGRWAQGPPSNALSPLGKNTADDDLFSMED